MRMSNNNWIPSFTGGGGGACWTARGSLVDRPLFGFVLFEVLRSLVRKGIVLGPICLGFSRSCRSLHILWRAVFMHEELRRRLRWCFRHLCGQRRTRRHSRRSHETVLATLLRWSLGWRWKCLLRWMVYKLHVLHLWREAHGQVALRIDYRYALGELHRHVRLSRRNDKVLLGRKRRRRPCKRLLRRRSIHELRLQLLRWTALRVRMPVTSLLWNHKDTGRERLLSGRGRLWRGVLCNRIPAYSTVVELWELLSVMMEHGSMWWGRDILSGKICRGRDGYDMFGIGLTDACLPTAELTGRGLPRGKCWSIGQLAGGHRGGRC